MAADGAALAEVKAGITFGVKLYVPWWWIFRRRCYALEEHYGCDQTRRSS